MTLQRTLAAAALTLVITAAYAVTADKGDRAGANSPNAPAAPTTGLATASTPVQGG